MEAYAQQILWLILTAIVGGPILSEFGGYVWHRWVAHLGVLRWLPADFMRRRHYDHHESADKYPPDQLRSVVYRESCEVTFHFLAGVLVPLIGLSVWMKWLSLATAIALLAGAAAYGILVQGNLHTSYHLEDATLQKLRIFQWHWVRRLHKWLRDCHDIHHFLNANYFILIPLFEWIFGTLVTRRKLEQEGTPLVKEDLFSRFKSLSSSCGKPLFR